MSRRVASTSLGAAVVAAGCLAIAAAPAGAAKTHSCGNAGGGFNSVKATGVTCKYATKTFLPALRMETKPNIYPLGFKCSYKHNGPRTTGSCTRGKAKITWKSP